MNVRLDAEWLKEWFALELATLADAQKQVRDARDAMVAPTGGETD